jgi:Transposase zinc-binding domain
VARSSLEVADILRDHGPAWREANRGHVSLDQLKVMSAIERCRTAALGGHVARCENKECAHTIIAYNSCRNRHCPKCQGAAARRWLAEREAELLPVEYFHVVYTLPAELLTIIRAPQWGQGQGRTRGSSGAAAFCSSCSTAGGGAPSSSRARAMLAARLLLANKP